MESLTLWARHGEAVRQALELGEMAHRETASAACSDACLLCAIASGLLKRGAGSLPEPRCAPEMAMAGLWPAPRAARCAGLDSMRKAGEVRRSARG
jgi:hypothetical protein